MKDDDPDEINSSPIYDHNVFEGYEANMGDPKTLTNFANWCMKEYPAKHYALIIWDHGSGFLGYENGKISSKNSSFRLKGISWDDTDEDYLTLPELQDALSEITADGSEKLDIVGFDACQMGMTEVFYELSPYAKYAVASEEVEWSPGWYYERILRDLTKNPKISPKRFAINIVDDYEAFYGDSSNTTISAIDMDEVGPVVSAIDNFSNRLIYLLPDRGDEIKKAREESQEYYYPGNIDLYHFAELIDKHVSDDKVKDAAKKVMNTIEKAVLAERHSMSHISYEEESRSVVNSHGIAHIFP